MKNYIKIMTATAFLLAACSQFDQNLEKKIDQPVLKEEPKLIYPFTAQQKNNSGTTEIIFTILKEGKVTQVNVKKSSGFKELDDAAVNYCQGLVFIPAKENGVPFTTKMKWEVKFNLKDLESEIQNKISVVKDLLSKAEQLEGSAKTAVQREILIKYAQIIDEMRDGVKFNEYVYALVQNNIKNEWKYTSEPYPLAFLLYYDFITRFKDYDSLRVVQSIMENTIKQDLNYLNNSGNIDESNKTVREALIFKIKKFVETNYPEINLKELNNETNLKNSNLS